MKRACAALLLLLAGCIEFTGATAPELPANDAEVILFLSAANPGPGSGATLRVAGRVAFPHGAGGARFVDDTLRLLGRSLAPLAVRRDGWELRAYEASLNLPAGALDGPFQVRFPTTAGVALARTELEVRVPARLGRDTMTLPAGADLVLPLHRGGVGGLEVTSEQWNVLVTRGSRQFQAGSGGPVPVPLRVPAGWIPDDTARVIRVELAVQRGFALVEGTQPPRVRMGTDARLQWTVRLAP